MSEENLLDALYRHGQQFLGDFGDSEPPHKRRKLYPDVKQNTTEEEQEWGGIGGDDTSGDEGSSDSEGECLYRCIVLVCPLIGRHICIRP